MEMISMKCALAGAAAGLCMAVSAFAPSAFAYPERPVTIVVPFGPGGPSDTGVRLLQPYFKQVTGKDLVILNKPGAGGAVGWSQINTLPADGHSLTMTQTPNVIIQPIVNAPMPYQTSDINDVFVYGFLPEVLAVGRESRFRNVQDIVSAAKANPGKLTVGGTHYGTPNHITYVLFERASGAGMYYVPYKDTSGSNTALIGGQLEVNFTWVTSAHALRDKIRPVAIAGEKRVPMFPDVPTLKELGYDVVGGSWWAIGVPRDVGDQMRKRIADVFARVVADNEYQAKMAEVGYTPLSIGFPETKEFFARQVARFKPIADQIGVVK
jgi:putative tricarboxylic transport membrane protein